MTDCMFIRSTAKRKQYRANYTFSHQALVNILFLRRSAPTIVKMDSSDEENYDRGRR